jgi:hypothetical protein
MMTREKDRYNCKPGTCMSEACDKRRASNSMSWFTSSQSQSRIDRDAFFVAQFSCDEC